MSVTISYLRPPTGTADTTASFFLDISITEGERTTRPSNIRHQTPSDVRPQPRKMEASTK